VYGVTWYDAILYSEWKSKKERKPYRLPTSSEWEKAARGVDGRWYPWGNSFDPGLCNIMRSRRETNAPVNVESYPEDVSIYGVRGMGGNVSDWTGTERIETDEKKAQRVCIVRGGAWLHPSILSRCACYSLLPPHTLGSIGFRLAFTLNKKVDE
jgi:serine/threonine-protein kinase